jgi:hypothetical protein
MTTVQVSCLYAYDGTGVEEFYHFTTYDVSMQIQWGGINFASSFKFTPAIYFFYLLLSLFFFFSLFISFFPSFIPSLFFPLFYLIMLDAIDYDVAPANPSTSAHGYVPINPVYASFYDTVQYFSNGLRMCIYFIHFYSFLVTFSLLFFYSHRIILPRIHPDRQSYL